MNPHKQKEFAVLLFAPEQIRCCIFRRNSKGVFLKAYASGRHDGKNPAKVWKQVLHDTGYSKDCPLIVSGALTGGIFFRCTSVKVPPKSMRGALAFELPQRLLADAADHEFEYVARVGEQDEFPVHVYAFPPSGMNSLAAVLTQSIGKADHFIYPLLALRDTDEPLYLPEVEPEFYFGDGEWHPVGNLPENWFEPWRKRMLETFHLPPELDIREWLGCLLPALLLVRGDAFSAWSGIDILPRELRPNRWRTQLRITAFLLLALLILFGWTSAEKLMHNNRTYSSLRTARNRLVRQVAAAQRTLKVAEKEQRELTRIVNQSPGETDVVGKLAAFSKILPENVMVQNLRWNDNTVDLVMRSEAESLKIQELIRPLHFWKADQVQQRRRNNDTASTIILKLSRTEGTR